MKDSTDSAYFEASIKIEAEEYMSEDRFNVKLSHSYAQSVAGEERAMVGVSAVPAKIEVPQYSKELLDAANEARQICRDSDVPGYTSMDDLKKALES